MPMSKEVKEKQFEFTADLAAKIGDINGNPSFSAEEKKAAIRELEGATMEAKMKFMEKNFRRFN